MAKQQMPDASPFQDRPPTSLADFFEKDAKTALIIGKDRWSRARLAREGDEFAAALHQAGVRPGNRVVLHLEAGPEIVLLYLACFRLGAIACPMYPHYKPAELEAMFRRLRPVLYVGHNELHGKIAGVDESVLPAEARFVVDPGENPSARSWSCLLGSSLPVPKADVDLDAAAVLLATSGTTGEPKLVAHSQASLAAYARRLAFREIRAGQVIAYTLELAHMPGIGHVLACLHHGATLVVVDRADPGAILDSIEAERCTYLAAVPRLHGKLAEHQRERARDVSSLQFCISLADACPPDIEQAFAAVFGLPLRSTWSSTEAAGSLTYGLQTGNVSRPTPGIEVRLVNDHDQPVAPGIAGEMMLKGDNVMLGYWKGPGEWDGLDAGWFRTGDLMREDDMGGLWFEGRGKDIIVVAGDNVSPVEVERVLAGHPAVRDVGVVGLEDAVTGQQVVAAVVLAEGYSEEIMQDILQTTSSQLADFKVPRRLLPVPVLPRSPAGKINRKQVVSFFAQDVLTLGL